MATLLDGQVGMKKETTWNTPVTVDRFYEALSDSDFDWDPMVTQAEGLRVGSAVPRAARRLAGVGKGSITLKANVQSKGFGVLLESIGGTVVSNLVSGSTYQQRCIPTRTTPVGPSYTIQCGVPESNAAGTVDAYTFAGCVAQSFEFEGAEDGPVSLSVSFWSPAMATATGLASASYPSSPTVFYDGAANVTTTFGGSLTVPTTTALASGGTAVTNVRAWTFSGELNINERGLRRDDDSRPADQSGHDLVLDDVHHGRGAEHGQRDVPARDSGDGAGVRRPGAVVGRVWEHPGADVRRARRPDERAVVRRVPHCRYSIVKRGGR